MVICGVSNTQCVGHVNPFGVSLMCLFVVVYFGMAFLLGVTHDKPVQPKVLEQHGACFTAQAYGISAECNNCHG